MPINTDPAHRATEEIIREMERRLAKEYRQAYNDLSAKLDDYLRRFETKDRIWRGWVANGTKTQEEYQKWRIGQIAIGERWSEMKQTIAMDLHNVNQIARSTVNGYMPEIYALNHNYATFEVERGSRIDTSYTLYDRQTVERIMRDNPDLMPGYKQNSAVARNIAAGRDVAWNKQKIQSSMLQGILQGESIDKMATRLQSVTTADYKAAVRYARTMATSAQNAGRYAGYQRVQNMGIDLTLVWAATLDERTRVSHRALDSEERDVNEPFVVDGVEIYYPGDLGGEDYDVPGYLVWNCRCTIIAQVKGFEYNIHGKDTDYSQIDGEYEDWKNAHESESEDIDAPRRRSDEIRDSYIDAYQNLGNSSRNNVQSDDGGGIIKSVSIGDFDSLKIALSESEKYNIDGAIIDIISQTLEDNGALNLFDAIAVRALDKGHVLDTVMNPNGSWYNCELVINGNFFHGVKMNTVDERIKNSNHTVCNSLKDCVKHEIAHGKQAKNANAEVIKRYNEESGIKGISPLAGHDMLETLAEASVLKDRGEMPKLNEAESKKLEEAAKELKLW